MNGDLFRGKNGDPAVAAPGEPGHGFHPEQSVGARLRAIRQARRWTLEEASKRSSVGRSTLSKIENDLMSPTFDLLKKITRGMQIDLVELFDERQQEQEPRERARHRSLGRR